MSDIVRRGLDKIENYTPGKPIEEVKRELGLSKVIKLASNENPFPPSGKVIKALEQGLKKINLYPDSRSFYLREFLSKKLKVGKGNLIFGNGSDELIVLALRAFVERGEEVIVGWPTFLIYEIQSKACGIKVVRSKLKGFRYDLKDILSKVTKKTKIIFIANPDNPNGTYLKDKEIWGFLKQVPRNTLVFLDEAYSEFAPEDFPKSIKFLKAGHNIIFTRTFSKVYGLAGLRIGYGITKKKFVQAMDKVREPFNVNSLAQVAALAALNDKRYLRKTVDYIKREKKFMYEGLDKLGVRFVKSATNFVLIDLGNLSAKDAFNKLLYKGVVVREMSPWGMDNFIRVTVGKREENKVFLKALKNVLKGDSPLL